ncbi:Protein of unknown function [Gryllus bimaculatus]|nr:Protein of unknown function [Gryllus bimaculatus]
MGGGPEGVDLSAPSFSNKARALLKRATWLSLTAERGTRGEREEQWGRDGRREWKDVEEGILTMKDERDKGGSNI